VLFCHSAADAEDNRGNVKPVSLQRLESGTFVIPRVKEKEEGQMMSPAWPPTCGLIDPYNELQGAEFFLSCNSYAGGLET
jgi:hypothetical protein